MNFVPEEEPFLPESTKGSAVQQRTSRMKLLLLGGGGFLVLLIGCIIGGLIGHFAFPNPPVSPYAGLLDDADPDITLRIINNVDGDSIAAYLRNLTQVPHVAGSKYDYEQAKWVHDHFKAFGLDAEIVPYKVLLSYPPADTPNKVNLIKSDGTFVHNFTSRQTPLFAPEEQHPDINSNFAAYSAQGQIKGKVVYAYYGRAEDYEILKKNNVNVEGAIVLARYGRIFRGNIVLEAQSRGAIGVLLFSDPQDFSPRGRDQVYPNTVDLPGFGVQSGTIMLSDGDPLTPNYPSIDSAYFDQSAKMFTELPKIPVQPIGYDDAEVLLKNMAGPSSPTEWQGHLSTPYNLGGAFNDTNLELHMDIRTTREQRTTYTVIGTLQGSVEKDRYVLLGNHRDAWSLGAIDPSSGTATLLEIARVYGKMAKEGWRPRRSLKFCSWGAEEYGLIGSIEWIEQNRKILEKQAVAYLNVDIAVEGNYSLYVQSVPLLYKVLLDSTKRIPNPNTEEIAAGRKTLYDTWMYAYPDGDRPKMHGLGSGSDYKGFIHNLGVPSLDFRYSYKEDIGSYPLYHTLYETYHLLTYLYDEGMAYMKSISQLWGEAARVLADSLVLPLSVNEYAVYIKKTFTELNSRYNQTLAAQGINLDGFKNAIDHFETQATIFEGRLAKVDRSDPFEVRALNDRLMLIERMFIDPLGISDRADVVNHILFAPSASDNYSSVGFAGLTDLIEKAKVTNDAADWENVKKHLSVIVFLMGEAELSFRFLIPFNAICKSNAEDFNETSSVLTMFSVFRRLSHVKQKYLAYRMASSFGEAADKRLIWVDLEMTGLDVDRDYIMEMACLITDENLNIIAEGPNVVIKQPDQVLNSMGEWCMKHHTESGLVAKCRSSTIFTQHAERMMLDFVEENTPKGRCALAGNSVHEDRRFLVKHMPRFADHLHYRIVDVSTIKELCRRWYPSEFQRVPKKQLKHRALEDIKESIEELKHYRANIFK